MSWARKSLILLAAIGLIAAISILVGLKIGRPTYYSDGNAGVAGLDLRDSGMLRWSEPQSDFEIPGPVRGRITELPDGLVIYGLARSEQTTDLVVFDRRNPGRPPQPVVELNSPGHELSPVLGPAGVLYFASDRRTGFGGFDIYSATYRNGLFFGARPLPAGINTGLDETDPTIDKEGGQLVFVRRDPQVDDGRNGQLMTAFLSAPADAKPVFPTEDAPKYRRALTPPIDRDPVFAHDGIGLYFVRQIAGRWPQLMRTSWHHDHYVTPMAIDVLQVGGPFRAPSLVADGFEMLLVTTTEPTTVFRSTATEVYPFWEGQWWLEWLLLYLILFFALLLVLLTLGAKWSKLDFITKLIVLSLLIHLLLLLWMSRVQIIRQFEETAPDTGTLQVNLVSQSAARNDSGSKDAQQTQADVSRELSFEGHEDPFRLDGPEMSVAANKRSLETASVARPSYTPTEKARSATLDDGARAFALREGVAREAEQSPHVSRAEADQADRTEANRRDVAAEKIRVVVPGTAAEIAAESRRRQPNSATPDARPRELPAPRELPKRVTVADAPSRPRVRRNQAEAGGEAATLRAANNTRVAATSTPSSPSPRRTDAGETAVPKATPAKEFVANAPSRRRAPAPKSIEAPKPNEFVANPESVNDVPNTQARNAGVATAEPTLRRSSRVMDDRPNPVAKTIEVPRGARSETKSVVAAPRTDLKTDRPARETARAERQIPRRIPRRIHPGDPIVAVADEVKPTKSDVAATRGVAPEALPTFESTDLKTVTPRSDVAKAKIPHRQVGEAAVDVPEPKSLMGRESRRHLAEAKASKPLERRESRDASENAVAIQDQPIETRPAPAVEIDPTKSQKTLAATALKSVERSADKSSPDAVRGDPTGAVRVEDRLPKPGSLLERGSRRSVVAVDDLDPSRKPADLVADAIELRDDAVPSKSTPNVAEVARPATTLSSRIAPVRHRGRNGMPRPTRDRRRAGLHDVSMGIKPPGSFLQRAGIRQGIPAVVARTEELTPYSNRFGANKLAALKKYGGTKETELAVMRGLAYLSRIQNKNGTWGNNRESQRKYGQVFIGKTGLCLLAFLGAGHTPDSNTTYSEVTRKAIDALLRVQRASGHFGVSSSYSHGITTYALAECYALTKSKRLREPLLLAVDWILANQNSRRGGDNRGGWGYFSSTLDPEDNYSRLSTTAWQIMALESAKLSGIEVPDRALEMAREFLLKHYDRRYRYFLYNKEPSRLRSEWRTLPASTPAAVFCLQLLGMESDEPRLAAGLEYTVDRRPEEYRRYSDDDFVLNAAGNVYFWYYGSLSCFMAGGKTWDRWNTALKRVLLEGQAHDGSFPLIDSYARYAGDTDRDRSYTTAMCVLSLEVYYRYFTPLLKGK